MADPNYSERLAGYFLLMNDITAPDNLIIADTALYGDFNDAPLPHVSLSDANCTHRFRGSFDGNGHTITVDIHLRNRSGVGLFGTIGAGGRVINLTIAGRVEGRGFVGALTARNHGEVTYTSSHAEVVGNHFVVGGLVGENYNNGEIIFSYATGDVLGDIEWASLVGGLVGRNSGIIEGSYATGDISGHSAVGGLVGANFGHVRSSFATGDTTGISTIGGLAGSNVVLVENSFATGNVRGATELGGLAGFNIGRTRYTYATGNVSGDIETDRGDRQSRYYVGSLIGSVGNRRTITELHSNVALSAIVTGPPEVTGRIWGGGTNYDASNNHASSAMRINGQHFTGRGLHDNQHGRTVPPEVLATEAFWRDTMGWDFDEVWIWDDERSLPTLRGIADTEAPPYYSEYTEYDLD